VQMQVQGVAEGSCSQEKRAAERYVEENGCTDASLKWNSIQSKG